MKKPNGPKKKKTLVTHLMTMLQAAGKKGCSRSFNFKLYRYRLVHGQSYNSFQPLFAHSENFIEALFSRF